MIALEVPLTDDDIERLGKDVYDRVVRPTLRPEDKGRFVMVDVATGDFEIDEDDYTASMRLRARRPDGEFWLMMAGYPTAYRFAGSRSHDPDATGACGSGD